MTNNKGQVSLSEYIIAFFLVVAAGMAMSVYIQRSLQARVHDARNYMISTAAVACDANCVAASGGVGKEYEPYYGVSSATANRDASTNSSIGGTPTNQLYRKQSVDTAVTDSSTEQLPPKDAL